MIREGGREAASGGGRECVALTARGSTLTPSPPPSSPPPPLSPLKMCVPLTVPNFCRVSVPCLLAFPWLRFARLPHVFCCARSPFPGLGLGPSVRPGIVLYWLVPILGLVPGFVLILALALVLRPSSQKEPLALLGILGGSFRGSPRGSHMGFLKEVPLGAALGAGRDHRGTP